MTLKGMIDDRLRRQAEWGNGRIEGSPAITQWLIGEGTPGARNQRKCHVTGRATEVVDKPSVYCPNPEVGKDYPAYNYRGQVSYSVPARMCQKCPHRGKRGQHRLPYSFCTWAREQRGGPQKAQEAYLKLFAAAAAAAASDVATERGTDVKQDD